MNAVLKIDGVVRKINKWLANICGILLFFIIILLIINTVSRELGMPIAGLSNISVIVLISVVYLGLAVTEQTNQHAAVELLGEKLKIKSRKILETIIGITKMIAIGIFLYASLGNFLFSIESGETFPDVVSIYLWPSKLAIVIGLFFFELQIILNLLKVIFEIEVDDSDEDLMSNM